jgi:hypothetical protein
MASPWAFGWTQLLTIIGFIITIAIAVGGFRTFGRWKNEKIEEKRIETAIEALALVYESKFIFDHIRSEMSFGHEWKDMPDSYGTAEQRNARGPFYAILKRIDTNKDFFERAWKMQVRCTALFGPQVEEIFLLMHRARREIEVLAGMLLRDPEPTDQSQANLETWNRFRADVWPAYGTMAKGGDQVGEKLSEFKTKMENLCRPIIDREYRREPREGIIGAVSDSMPQGPISIAG